LITLARGGLVDVGTGELVIVLSGLNGKVPLEEMQNRPVVLLMNLKPAKVSTALPCVVSHCHMHRASAL
jgi:hypothetical protein